ncbi:HTH domain-containing protein [Pseudoalteromonas shioyasakiensis]|uniref:HTH-type transcriptional regulator n=1 Tax=Pseudoalteromonas gelatinilytica TaxID=1703256 RepID=A0A3A3EKB8_9GAMM|nr:MULTISPECIES: MarR family transcriptional regulator [Pseudoalteromonas]MAD03709.1 transcriptional regulator [Pseudoalteromonas sp.]MCG9736137.1 HTH domain-containing protein [Pseudoalteromonas shioyasakiensis]MCQ8880276.1 HTH domain-containing protein [Pseudoalteromonas shioyasakiensis]MDK9682557.1 HTH domain-containing protein [Pseudoalteromonas shioyasakiensis]NIZ04528.1 HTH domain-containing protein [Pseudoalteromonas sp. HF66]|tara:strand:- start:19456 stop:20013 length:558 start_codon:yes stop_codon:yes gene_type:complete
MSLSEKNLAFVMHCGEMGSRWGFNRTIGQMCGLLTITKEPMTANEIADTLSISRGNVSMGIKELQSWRLIKVHHIPGDRKEYYGPAGSIWDMANRVFEERKKREIDPTLSLLRDNILEEAHTDDERFAQQQMQEIHDLLETVTKWSAELQRLSPEQLQSLMKLGSGIGKVLDFKDKILKKPGKSE